ncbi:MAG TPA: hypothetical protein VFG23_14275 [Polyangia bacterium]|nr:hypothetical protein [Polyangia bacterium]
MSVETPGVGATVAPAPSKKIGRRWKVHRAPPHPAGLSYQDLRDQIRTGDLLLFRGNRIFSDAIERLSDSPYSHVAILARWNDRVIAFQADTQGVQLLPASKMVCKYQGKVDWWSLKQKLREDGIFDPKALLDASLTLLGIKYGYWTLIKLGFRILLGRAVPRKDAHATPDSLFCSQFVSRCFRAASHDVLDVNPNADDACTSPANFATSGFFEQRYALFDGSNGQACREMLETPFGRNRPDVVPWDGLARRPATAPAHGPAGQSIKPT